MPLPVPVHDDPDTQGFFAAAAKGTLALCSCGSCGAVLHLPRPYCSSCGSSDTEWQAVSPTGTLYSWTTVEHQVARAFDVPYTIILVELDDAPGVRLLGHLEGRPSLQAGQRFRARFDDRRDGVVVPQWEAVEP